MTDARTGPALADINGHYDRALYNPQMLDYFQCDFADFGWWEAGTASQREACERLMDRLIAWLPADARRVLDVACGKGATSRHLARARPGACVTGVNVSARQLETARAIAPGCHFARMDAVRLGFADAAFDAVVCVEAAFHFDTREDFLREAHRVLRPGGRLVLSDTLMTREAERRRLTRTERNYLAGLDDYRALCERIGFEDVEIVDATEPCWRGYFRAVVGFVHERYLEGKITAEELDRLLDTVYGLVPDMESYLLMAATKPSAGR